MTTLHRRPLSSCCARWALTMTLACTLSLAAGRAAMGVSLVSSAVTLEALAEASNASESDSDHPMQTVNDVEDFADSLNAGATTSTASADSGALLNIDFEPALVTLNGDADSSVNGGVDNPASAFGRADYDLVFSSTLPVQYQLSGGLSSDSGDSTAELSLRRLTDNAVVFNFLATGGVLVEPMEIGILAPGDYRLRASVSASSFADEFSSGEDSLGSVSAELQLTNIPEPPGILLASVTWSCVVLSMKRRLRNKL